MFVAFSEQKGYSEIGGTIVMKKIISLFTVLLLSLCFCGCRQTPIPEETVNGFWNAMESGDISTARTYVSGEAEDYMNSLISAESAMKELMQSFEVTEEISGKLDTLSSGIARITFRSHEITDTVKLSETNFKFSVSVISAGSDTFNSALRKVDYETALEEHAAEITKIMTEEGTAKAYSYMFGIIFDYLNENLDAVEQELVYNENPVIMLVEKNNDGKWIITNIDDAEEAGN